MKCKKCGGELRFQNGVCVCQSCGVTFSLDSVYENIDACICYEENDEAGRRTRDSIIAQEVYRKLEENKVATFYERISADGMTGGDLEESKLAAIHRAKVIIVLGSSVENFAAIEAKYGKYFNGKAVIPFCVDVNPSAIPKTLSKIQAMSYSTIGWDKDLIKGVYNILGREQVVDTGSLYGRSKRKIVLIGVVALLVVIAAAVAGWIFMKPAEDGNAATSTTEETTEPTTKPLTQKEIYDNASALLEQGDLVGALELLVQIPDHPNSANMMHQIYSKYEGYYQTDNVSIHLEILDNNRVEIELKIVLEENVVSINVNAEILTNKVSADYLDNNSIPGKLNLALNNEGITLGLESEAANTNTTFKLSEKSDQPIVQINKEILFNWLKNEYTYNQIRNLGYDFELFYNMPGEGPDVGGENVVYKLKGTNVYLSMIRWGYGGDDYEYFQLDDAVLVGVAAPAELIAPSLIGKTSLPTYDDEIIYWPNAFLMYCLGYYEWETESFASSNTNITSSTIIGTLLKTCKYGSGIDEQSVINEWILAGAEKAYDMEFISSCKKVAENTTHYLYKVDIRIDETFPTSTDLWAWCKVNKSTWSTTFITDRTIVTNTLNMSSDYSGLDFSDDRYPVPSDISTEFNYRQESQQIAQNLNIMDVIGSDGVWTCDDDRFSYYTFKFDCDKMLFLNIFESPAMSEIKEYVMTFVDEKTVQVSGLGWIDWRPAQIIVINETTLELRYIDGGTGKITFTK